MVLVTEIDGVIVFALPLASIVTQMFWGLPWRGRISSGEARNVQSQSARSQMKGRDGSIVKASLCTKTRASGCVVGAKVDVGALRRCFTTFSVLLSTLTSDN